jgi:hypothetical protein
VPLTVENGTGLVDAESFISVADASTRHTAFGNAAWAALASDTVREQLLRQATAKMEGEYRLRWNGTRISTTQALSWPRYDVPIKDAPGQFGGAMNGYGVGSYYPNNTVPADVANACADLALRAITGPLTPDTERAVKREKVGPLETEYEPGSIQSTRFDAVENMLRPYLKDAGMFLPVTRA